LADQEVCEFICNGNPFSDITEVAGNAFFVKELRKEIEGMNGVALIQQKLRSLAIAGGKVDSHGVGGGIINK